MSWAYWAPKSTTRMVSKAASKSAVTVSATEVGSAPRRRHAHALGALHGLALGLEGGRHHHLRLLELLDGGVAACGHRGAQGAEEVEPPVVLVGRPREDLAQGAPRGGVHAGAAGQRGVERRHPPVEA